MSEEIDLSKIDEYIASASELENLGTNQNESTIDKATISDTEHLFGAGPNSIEYNLGTKSNVGSFVAGYTPPEDYTPGVDTDLPPADKIIPPAGRTFICWMVDDERVSKVGAAASGKVVATAVYRVDKDFYFGMYPQSSTLSTVVDPIKWVLHEHDDKVIAISKKAIDYKPFHNVEVDITWADCDLRDWTANSFYPNAFNADEKNVIEEVINQNRENPVTHVSSGIDTTDRVFVLDYFQGFIYFKPDVGWANDDRKRQGTPYVKYKGGINLNWPTRTMGSSGHKVVTVLNSGYIAPGSATQPENGVSVNVVMGFVPAMFLDMDEPLYNAPERNITWILDGAEWLDESTWVDYKYREGYEVTLPEERNFKSKPTDSNFLGWRINDSASIVTAIPASQTGNINLKTLWGYDINWILGAGNDWAPGYVASSSYIFGETLMLPTKDNVVGPTGQELDYWTVNSRQDTAIRPTDTGVLDIEAHYKNANYQITWDLGTGTNAGSWDNYTPPENYEYGTGLDLNALPMSSKVKPPRGREFDHWNIGGTPGTVISGTDYGPKTIQAVYRNIIYNIDWNIQDASWVSGSPPYSDYEYSVGRTLPNASTLDIPAGKTFGYWTVNGYQTNTINNTKTGEVKVVLVYSGTPQHNIMWDLGFGNIDTLKYSQAMQYTEGVAMPLPVNEQMIPPTGQELDHWTVNDVVMTEIPATFNVDATIKAFYRTPAPPPTPAPTPGPTPPGGDGGGRSSGGSFYGSYGTSTVIDKIIFTYLQTGEYEWIKNFTNNNWGIKVKKTTAIARALINGGSAYVKYYDEIDDNYIRLKNGIFNLRYLDCYASFAFDVNGNMMTGVVDTSYACNLLVLDVATAKFNEVGTFSLAKFYCCEEKNAFEGLMWSEAVIVKNVSYTFDEYGRITSQTNLINNVITHYNNL